MAAFSIDKLDNIANHSSDSASSCLRPPSCPLMLLRMLAVSIESASILTRSVFIVVFL